MGLDITYYEKIEAAPDFKGELDGSHIHYGLIYFDADGKDGVGHLDGLPEGVMKVSGTIDGFRAASYGHYSKWRYALEQAVKKVSDKPFDELINFCDCAGIIGPTTSAKLAGDFKANRERVFAAFAQSKYEDGGYYCKMYDDFLRAFQTAAYTGCVELH